MSETSKTSWDYQKNRYKQINIKFNMEDEYDAMLHWYLTCKVDNASRLIKDLISTSILERRHIWSHE